MPRKTKQNEITSPELLNQVNPDNVRLKQDFIAYLQSVQRSPKTIAGYSNDIDIFWVWNLQNNGNKIFSLKFPSAIMLRTSIGLLTRMGTRLQRVRRLKSGNFFFGRTMSRTFLDDEDEFKDFRRRFEKLRIRLCSR